MRRIGGAVLGVMLLGAAARAEQTAIGVGAMPDQPAKVAGALLASPGQGAGAETVRVQMSRRGERAAITDYEVELSKRLHLIAVSDDLRDFVHEHGEAPDPAGVFRVTMDLPRAGVWHVYADAVPAGLGQQVLRFDLDLGGPAGPAATLAPTGPEATDGRYGARFAALDLRAGSEAELALTLLRDGAPADDVRPFLGVAAHAVFIAAADRTYLHAHAAPAAAMAQDMAGMAMPAMPADAAVAPELMLHVRPPHPGLYALWVQFMAGGAVRTVRFVVPVS